MLTYILTRVVSMLISLVAVSIIAFLIIQLPPGDFIDYLETRSIGTEPQFVSEEEVEALRAHYGLDRPHIRPVLEMGRADRLARRSRHGVSVESAGD